MVAAAEALVDTDLTSNLVRQVAVSTAQVTSSSVSDKRLLSSLSEGSSQPLKVFCAPISSYSCTDMSEASIPPGTSEWTQALFEQLADIKNDIVLLSIKFDSL